MAQTVKNLSAKAEDLGSIPESGKSPGEGHGNSFWYSCLENSMDRGSCQATSLWGHKESDTTEVLTHTHTHTHTQNWTTKEKNAFAEGKNDQKRLIVLQINSRKTLP